ncbi:MAG: hypothetical protein QXW00_03620 [Candidatus Woesearchaeota archaeon]
MLRLFSAGRDSEFKKIKAAFDKLKKEMDVHLSTINDNSIEIEANYEYLCKLEEKVDKLSEKVEQLQLLIAESSKKKTSEFSVEPLNLREQEVFLALYLSDGFVKYSNIASQLGLPEQLVKNYVTALIRKGVPVIKKYQNGETFIMLDPDFKRAQTRENILGISQEMLKEFKKGILPEIRDAKEGLDE